MNNVHSSCLQWQKYTDRQPGSVQWDACWWGGNIQSGNYLPRESGVDVRVCKAFFHRVLCLTDGRIARATKLKVHGLPHSDGREKQIPHNKTQANCGYVKDFITKFPSYSSHYSRNKHPNRSYLAPDLNTDKMYSLYQTECQNYNPPQKPVSNHIFCKIFNEDLTWNSNDASKAYVRSCPSLLVSHCSMICEKWICANARKDSVPSKHSQMRSLCYSMSYCVSVCLCCNT